MRNIVVAGIGTGVGKTVVSAILTTLMEGNYWKPVQCGEEPDTALMATLIDTTKHHIHPSIYDLKAPVSPHHAASLEGISINVGKIFLPHTKRPLIIESVGGIFVPLTPHILSFDLFKSWEAEWIIVSRHYLGSINHTLMTIDCLKRNAISVAGLIFNGELALQSEAPILEISGLPLLVRLLPETHINSQTIQRYAREWRPNFH